MKSLVEFIKESRNILERKFDYVLVEPTGKAYDELAEEMADAMLSNNSDPDMFVLTPTVAKDMAKKYGKDIIIWKIPSNDLEKFESDYEDGKFDYNELEEIDPKTLEY